jgi:hypothetical protein
MVEHLTSPSSGIFGKMRVILTHATFFMPIAIVNTAVFVAIALAHLLRLVYQSPATIGSIEIPLWLSLVAIAGAVVLAHLNWQSLKKSETAV